MTNIVEIRPLCTLQNPKQSANYATHCLWMLMFVWTNGADPTNKMITLILENNSAVALSGVTTSNNCLINLFNLFWQTDVDSSLTSWRVSNVRKLLTIHKCRGRTGTVHRFYFTNFTYLARNQKTSYGITKSVLHPKLLIYTREFSVILQWNILCKQSIRVDQRCL